MDAGTFSVADQFEKRLGVGIRSEPGTPNELELTTKHTRCTKLVRSGQGLKTTKKGRYKPCPYKLFLYPPL